MNLYHGDCLEVMKTLDDKSIDCIICDPPFSVTACSWDIIIPFDDMWREYNRICKGAIVLFGIEPFSSMLRLSNIKNYKYDWIWEKNTGTNFLHAKRMPVRYTENIHVFYSKEYTYNPQKTTGHVPTNSGKGRNTGNVYSGKSKVEYEGGDTTRYPKNILKFNTVDNYHRLHPTQKPVDLIEYLIKTYTNENDIVLDNCMGSFTTAVACDNTNRNWIGIEKDEEYCRLGKNRIEENRLRLKSSLDVIFE